jgi:hypothetical protein
MATPCATGAPHGLRSEPRQMARRSSLIYAPTEIKVAFGEPMSPGKVAAYRFGYELAVYSFNEMLFCVMFNAMSAGGIGKLAITGPAGNNYSQCAVCTSPPTAPRSGIVANQGTGEECWPFTNVHASGPDCEGTGGDRQ